MVFFSVSGIRFAISTSHCSELESNFELPPSKFLGKNAGAPTVAHHRGKNLAVHDLRYHLGLKTYQDEVSEMKEFIQAREKDHVDWLESLRESVTRGIDFKKATDPKLCNFGKWYESVRNSEENRKQLMGNSLVLNHTFDAFDEPHKRIHGLAVVALGLSAKKREDEAMALIQNAWDTDLAAMKKLFVQFIDLFTEKMKPQVLIASIDGHDFMLSVDEIESVRDIAEDVQVTLPDAAQCGETLGTRGLIQSGKIIYIVEPHRLLRAIGATKAKAA